MAEKHLKKYSTDLAVREMQIKTILRFYLTPVRMAKIMVMSMWSKGEHSSIARGSANLYSHYGNQDSQSS